MIKPSDKACALAGLAWALLVCFRSFGAGTAAESGLVAVDTRGTGDLTVSGRVLDAATEAPLVGASVVFGGGSATTCAGGAFELVNVDRAGAGLLVAEASGYVAQERPVETVPEQKSVHVGDLFLSPATGKPVVESVSVDPEWFFLNGFSPSMAVEVRVNWNGKVPGEVRLHGDGALVAGWSGAGPVYSGAIDTDEVFSPLVTPGILRAVAVAADETESTPVFKNVRMTSWPYYFESLEDGVLQSGDRLWVDFVPDAIVEEASLPVLGTLGLEFGFGGSFDYGLRAGSWELVFGIPEGNGGGRRGKRPVTPGFVGYARPELVVGQNEVAADACAVGSGGATLGLGLQVSGISGSFEAAGNVDLGPKGFAELLGPRTATAFRAAGAGGFPGNFAVEVRADSAATGNLVFEEEWPLLFEEGNAQVGVDLCAIQEVAPNDSVAARVYLGGQATATSVMAGTDFESIEFSAASGAVLTAYGFEKAHEYVLLDGGWAARGGQLPPDGVHHLEGGYLVEAAGNAGADWAPMDRAWRDEGPEQWLAPGPLPAGPGMPAEVELPIVQNVFPRCEPAIAANGEELMLLYVRDTGAANAVQFTGIAFTRYDGSSWSAPAGIASMANAQFAPAVAFDGNGEAVAVWEQAGDAGFSQADLGALSGEIGIVWSRWDAGSGTWTAPAALTGNGHLDHAPDLAGPLADGDLLLTWRENEENRFAGEGAAGDAGNTRVKVCRWDAATRSWGTVETLVDQLVHDQSHAFGAGGGKAVYAWTKDLDGNVADGAGAELFYRLYDAGSGEWGAEVRHTNDGVLDVGIEVSVTASGTVHAVWRRGGQLVTDVDWSGTPVVVRPEALPAGFAGTAVTAGAAGDVAVLWQGMTGAGPSLHCRVFDPASGTWGQDAVILEDGALERSVAVTRDSTGNLVLAYCKVEVLEEEREVEVGGGTSVTAPGTPRPGRADLVVARKALRRDLAMEAGSLEVAGTGFLPGEVVTLKAAVVNTGDVAEEDVEVTFYVSDPEGGGGMIGTAPVQGSLGASERAEVSVDWTAPGGGGMRTVTAVADAAGAVPEADEQNNRVSAGLGGVDLEVRYMSGSVLPDGSVRVVSRVRNIGAGDSPVCTLQIEAAEGGDPHAGSTVSLLGRGEWVEIPLDLPAGSHAEGEALYRLVLDEEGWTGDVDPGDNEVVFSLNLWVDGDRDGLPAAWEAANGTSDSDAGDARQDLDGDGFTMLEEYRAGTDAGDGASFLKFERLVVGAAGGVGTRRRTVSWASVAGRLYNVERSYDLKHWVVVARNVQARPPLNSVQDEAPALQGRAFYRLVLLDRLDRFEYGPLEEAVDFELERVNGTELRRVILRWRSEDGRRYAVERSPDLENWEVAAEKIPAAGVETVFEDVLAAGTPRYFYRVLRSPGGD